MRLSARPALAALGLVMLALFALGGVASAQEETGETGGQDLSHEAEECVEILEDGGEPDDCQEAPSPILPESKEIIWGGLSFVVLFALLAKIAYPQIKKGMEARTERIRNNLDDAERVRTEAETILEDYQRQLADARSESNRIIEEARQTADQLRRDLMQRAEAEVAELRQRSQEDIAAAQQRALADLRSQVSDLAVELAEMLVKTNLDRTAQQRLIDDYITQVGAQRP